MQWTFTENGVWHMDIHGELKVHSLELSEQVNTDSIKHS